MLQLVPTLQVLQKLKVAHRDIKPANIIYNPATENFTLIDFGVGIVNETGRLIGSIGYISSLVAFDADHLSLNEWFINDIFSLGATIFYLLNRKYAFEIGKGDPNGLTTFERSSKLDYKKPNIWIWNQNKIVVEIVSAMLKEKYNAKDLLEFFDFSKLH